MLSLFTLIGNTGKICWTSQQESWIYTPWQPLQRPQNRIKPQEQRRHCCHLPSKSQPVSAHSLFVTQDR